MVADSLGSETLDHLTIHDLGRAPGGRLGRFLIGSVRVLRAVLRLRPSMIHIHDPELVPVCVMLSWTGLSVIYDVHEDMPTQILAKHWLPRLVRRPIAWLVGLLERMAGRNFSAVVAATQTIGARFPAKSTVLVRNYPLLSEFRGCAEPGAQRPRNFVYIGVIATIRGAEVMVDAIGQLGPGVEMTLAGNYSPRSLRSELVARPGWGSTVEKGWLDRRAVTDLLDQARAGLVVLQPTANYIDSLPVKMFEYMAAGIPVIASDFPKWRRIVEDAGCGYLVDPEDPQAVAHAMHEILTNPLEAAQMGVRGRMAVQDRYSFEREAEGLLTLYRRLLSSTT